MDEKLPEPLLIHAVPALLLALAPVTILTAPVFEQVVIAVPADAVGAALFVKVTVEVEEEHVPLLIVQVKVALVPAVIPVTPEVAEAGVVIVAVPLVTVHKPLPVLGVFPAKVNAAVLH